MQKQKLKAPDPEIVHYNLRRLLGSDLLKPKDMFIFDLETTDVDPLAGVIWQIGYHSVTNGKPCEDTPEGASIWLAHDADRLRGATFEISRRRNILRGEEPDGRTVIKDADYHKAEEQFIEEVRSKGVPPRDAIVAITDMVNIATAQGCILGGTNIAKFDIPWIEMTCQYMGIAFKFPSDGLLDLGMQIKAAILGRKILPRETYRAFYIGISEIRAKGVYFAVSRFCIPFWKLDEKYGVDETKAHGAGYDTYITLLSIHELIEMARNSHAK